MNATPLNPAYIAARRREAYAILTVGPHDDPPPPTLRDMAWVFLLTHGRAKHAMHQTGGDAA